MDATDHVYIDAAEAREVYAEQHDLNRLPADIRDQFIPDFPVGTREHAEFAAKVRAAITKDKPFGFLFD